MQIDKVTITGADDSTDFKWMIDVSRRYPFVEWGILVSQSQMGSPRFPSMKWMHSFCTVPMDLPVSIHVCGRWVREICKGAWGSLFNFARPMTRKAQRVQLNFHADVHSLDDAFFYAARKISVAQNWQLIFQADGENDALFSNAFDEGINAAPLYDVSGGAGVVPDEWPQQMPGVYTGYAGGLGPHNILGELSRIEDSAAPHATVWIDMETKVRTVDNMTLDTEAVESVLQQVAGSGYLVPGMMAVR